MAAPAPSSIDVTDIQFQIQSKIKIFTNDSHKDNCSLLATASAYGLVIAGGSTPELRVLQLQSLIENGGKLTKSTVPLRSIELPSEPSQIALSSDHSYLAVDVLINGVPFIQVYLVPSFYSANVIKIIDIRLANNSRSKQISWNPVMSNIFSVCTDNGELYVYTLKEQGFELHSADKSHKVQCVCWSPKGKQLVAGFANGNLVQYKPDLKPARSIPCNPNLLNGVPFDVIALQWLSTYQVAAVFLAKNTNSLPLLHIINAPKAGNPSFINYDDICYSQTGPRSGQVFLIHILQWNILLVASANSLEVGILGTTETGESPTWQQWFTSDHCRAELPLTTDKQETYPIGFTLETGCTHRIPLDENLLPVMPMIHLLTTHGYLVSFNLLNLIPSQPGICSPPNTPGDLSGQALFKLYEFAESQPKAPVNPPAPSVNEMSFAITQGSTSTPSVTKTKSIFGSTETKPMGSLFGGTTPTKLFEPPSTVADDVPPPNYGALPTSTFGKVSFGDTNAATTNTNTFMLKPGGNDITNLNSVASNKQMLFGNQAAPKGLSFGSPAKNTSPVVTPQQKPQIIENLVTSASVDAASTKPLLTVSQTFTPALPTKGSNDTVPIPTKQDDNSTKIEQSNETNNIIKSMIQEELQKFTVDINDLMKRSKNVKINIGTQEESVKMIRSLNELQDLRVQATESTDSLTSEVQSLRLGLNEAFAMIAEANSKSTQYRNQNQLLKYFPHDSQGMSQTSKRQLSKLQSTLSLNETNLQLVSKIIDSQWSAYQDLVKRNSKNRMHVPSLDNIYQILTKQQDIINKYSGRIKLIKSKLGLRENIKVLNSKKSSHDSTVESLTDSIISMSIAEDVASETARLTDDKLQALRDILRNRNIVIIKPKRPDRPGLNSEVIREKRNLMAKKNISIANKNQKNKVNEKVVLPKEISNEVNKIVSNIISENEPTEFVKPTTKKPVEITPSPWNQKSPFSLDTSPSTATKMPVFAPKVNASPTNLFKNTFESPTLFSNLSTNVNTTSESIFSSKPFSVQSLVSQPNPVESTTGPVSIFSKAGSTAISFGGNDLKTNMEQTTPFSFILEDKAPVSSSPPIVLSKTAPLFPFSISTKPDTSNTTKPVEVHATPAIVPELKNISTPPPSTITSFLPSSTTLTLIKSKDPAVTIKEDVPKKDEVTISSFNTFSFGTPPKLAEAAEPPKTTSIFGNIGQSKPMSNIFGSPSMPAENKSEGQNTTVTAKFTLPSVPKAAATAPATTESSAAIPTSRNDVLSPISTFSFGENLSISLEPPASNNNNTVTAALPSSAKSVATVTTAPVTTQAASAFSFTSSISTISSSPFLIATTKVDSNITSTTTSSTDGLFKNFNVCSPTTTASATTTTTANIFGSSPLFGTPKNDTLPGLFGSVPPKPDQSIFGTKTPTSTPSAFGPPATGGSIFGSSNSFGFGGNTAAASPSTENSIFGGAATNAFAPANPASDALTPSAAPTGPVAASPFNGSNIFGSMNSATNNTGGSIFGGSAGAAPDTSIFSGGATSGGGSATGFGSSAFGQPASPAQSSSIFSGGSSTTSAFGQTTGAFNLTNTFGSPGGSSIAETGFGSPSSGFANPTFGGAPTFGGSAFGSTNNAVFGAAPSFSSPTSFGGFGGQAGNANPALSSPTQSNPLFEQLGSSNTGMTFGALAQSAAPPKPQEFGGSAFSSWR